ncbi:hypothetical protein OG455_09045 [Kitasatospora sp. NBC_01287]|uniref:hypothetical protein n=1 Tax=Kitasatospora sp. NBC_01287 TaxID=2903573 RepID=UPI00224CD735|nr:hypothetical protein [Kitasatospora sp. NBC_01287]MCX4745666.1 hypothetical protein [Kitasatospora sp. NBC_01287]
MVVGMLSLRALPRTVRRPAPVVETDRARLLDRFNAAVRYPDAHGGVAGLPLLLDALATGEAAAAGTRWIVDDNARLNMAALVRYSFPEPEIHVVAAEYGAAGHERGWLRLERMLPAQDYARLVDNPEKWEASDRTLDDVLEAHGRPSVAFGDPDPRMPKTLGYASADLAAPLALLHFGVAGDAPSARLLAFRCGDGFLGAGIGFTPFGDTVADEREKRRG